MNWKTAKNVYGTFSTTRYFGFLGKYGVFLRCKGISRDPGFMRGNPKAVQKRQFRGQKRAPRPVRIIYQVLYHITFCWCKYLPETSYLRRYQVSILLKNGK